MSDGAEVRVGPVLSFRGAKKAGNETLWQVCALIGIPADAAVPELQVEGNRCPAPALLHQHGGIRILRYDLTVGLRADERKVGYGFGGEPTWSFTVPSNRMIPRMAYVSCNGFSAPSGMRKLIRPANAVWSDLLCNHDRRFRPHEYRLDKEQLWHEERTHAREVQRFHLMLMGGDQIYFDAIWDEIPQLKEWVGLSREEQLRFKVSADLRRRIENYYFGLYAERWLPPKRGKWSAKRKEADGADAMASIPTVMMWDDHDIFDGWGSYSPQMQQCELFKTVFRHARQAFWVFQMQHALADLPELEPAYPGMVSEADPQFLPISWSLQLQKDRLALPLLDNQPGFTFAHHIGPAAILVADLRTERSRTQILSEPSWQAMQNWMRDVNGAAGNGSQPRCQHFLFMSSVPVAHPKLSLAEAALDIFGQEHVLDSNADDLNDHWAHDSHEGERKRLIETLARLAREKILRVAILSGDVHVAAWGIVNRKDAPAAQNWGQIQQLTSSGIVHPSLSGVFERLFLAMLNSAAAKLQSIDIAHDIEMMLFPGHNRYVMPARNWLALEMNPAGDAGLKLWATWRCENKEGFSNHLQAIEPALPT